MFLANWECQGTEEIKSFTTTGLKLHFVVFLGQFVLPANTCKWITEIHGDEVIFDDHFTITTELAYYPFIFERFPVLARCVLAAIRFGGGIESGSQPR